VRTKKPIVRLASSTIIEAAPTACHAVYRRMAAPGWRRPGSPDHRRRLASDYCDWPGFQTGRKPKTSVVRVSTDTSTACMSDEPNTSSAIRLGAVVLNGRVIR